MGSTNLGFGSSNLCGLQDKAQCAEVKSQFWSFFIVHLTGDFWAVASWDLLKKIIFTCAMNFTDDKINAFLALGIQTVDTSLILWTQPQRIRDTCLMSRASSVGSLLIVASLSLSVLFPGAKDALDKFGFYLSAGTLAVVFTFAMAPSAAGVPRASAGESVGSEGAAHMARLWQASAIGALHAAAMREGSCDAARELFVAG